MSARQSPVYVCHLSVCVLNIMVLLQLNLLPRLFDASGVHRSPAFGLAMAGLLRQNCRVSTVDLFPMSLAGGRVERKKAVDWELEAKRFVDFFGSTSLSFCSTVGRCLKCWLDASTLLPADRHRVIVTDQHSINYCFDTF